MGWRFETPYRKKGDDLKNEIKTVRSLAASAGPTLASWPWFINRVIYPDEFPPDESFDTFEWAEGHAMDFLRTVTGEEYTVTGNYTSATQNVVAIAGGTVTGDYSSVTQDVRDIIAIAGDTVSRLVEFISSSRVVVTEDLPIVSTALTAHNRGSTV